MSDTNSFRSQELATDLPRANGDDTAKIIDSSGHALGERLGVGGMGEVCRFGDDALQRDLAIKILRHELRGNVDAEERFLREARLTGSLQHPSVVPIHNLSRLADGRPCYTMKLVRGRTFADMLRDEPQGPERLPRLLAILEKVCQAVAYAHSKHVIHRDLKPSNVMVGEFGEVQVMDWGLAKELHLSEPSPPLEATEDVETAAWTKEADGLSRAGSALGTPAYMPPEQAAGDWDIVDERAHVFALGAILCEMLTGRPPHHGANRDDLLRRARRGDMAEALSRLEKCGSDALLVNLCRECLAAERLQRPRHADVVAERLAAYQAEVRERLRQAELQRARAEVKALEERKRRRLVAALAVLVLLAVLSIGGGAWWLDRQRAKQRRGVEAALAEVQRLQQQARWAEAGAVLEQAKDRLGEGGMHDLRQQLEQARRDLNLVARLDAIRLKRATVVEGKFNYAIADREYAAAFQEAGLGKVGEESAAVAARIGNSAVRGVLVTALDDWALCAGEKRRDWLLEVARKTDPDPERDRLRDPALWNDGKALARLANTARADGLSPQLLVALSLRPDLGAEAEPLLRTAQQRLPSDFWVNFQLGSTLWRSGKPGEAEGFFRVALVLRPGIALAHYSLGVVLLDLRRVDEAVAQCKKATAIDPKDAGAHFNLGAALHNKGRVDEAVAEYRKAIDLDPKYAAPHGGLGAALYDLRRLDQAIDEYHQAIALNPKDAVAHNNLGNALRDKGCVDEAIAEYKKAIDLDPKYAAPHNNLGNALGDKGRVDEAIAEYKKALAIDPKYAQAHNNLADALYSLGRVSEAAAEYREAVALRVAGSLPQLQRCQRLLALGKSLPAVLRGEKAPADASQRIDLAYLTYSMKRYDLSARLFVDAFTAEPKFADDFPQQHRYNAGCSAALAAARPGGDARQLPDKVVTMFRCWALGWLRDDLSAYAKSVEQNKADENKTIQQRLTHWRRDPDLASVRDSQALDRLPDNERAAWQSLWRDADKLAAQVAKKTN